MLIRRGNLDQGYIKRQFTPAEKPGNLGQENGREISPSFCHRFAYIGSDEKRIVTESVFQLRIRIRCDPKGENMGDLCIGEF